MVCLYAQFRCYVWPSFLHCRLADSWCALAFLYLFWLACVHFIFFLLSYSFSHSSSILFSLTIQTCHFNWITAPGVKGSGVNGIVYASEPLNACSPLTIKAVKGPPSPFALIVRGGCTFDEKVKNAQDAGFKAAIVYDNENSGVLVSSNFPCHLNLFLSIFLMQFV